VSTWQLLALLALCAWGFWGLFFNLTSRHLDSVSALVWEVLGALIVAVFALLAALRWSSFETHGRGALFGMATGISYTVGLLLAFAALRIGLSGAEVTGNTGRISFVLILTALYPLLAVALNYLLLSEPVSSRQILALALGLAAVLIIVTE